LHLHISTPPSPLLIHKSSSTRLNDKRWNKTWVFNVYTKTSSSIKRGFSTFILRQVGHLFHTVNPNKVVGCNSRLQAHTCVTSINVIWIHFFGESSLQSVEYQWRGPNLGTRQVW
jgi:hypothetical protein